MGLFEGVFNFNAYLGMFIMLIFIGLTIYSLIHTRSILQKEHLIVAIGIELLLLYFIYYTMTHFSKKTKRVLGGLDVANAIF